MKKIAVLGDGGWGTTLAIQLNKNGFKTTLWSAFKDYANYLNKKRTNTKFLSGIKIPKSIEITSDLKEALDSSLIIILAIPSQYLRSVLQRLKGFDLSKTIVVNVAKGIEKVSLRRMSEVISEELGDVKQAMLSGPTIAREVAFGIPTTAVIASNNLSIAKLLQGIFNSERFRIYTNKDLMGVELGASLKNVIAIACGISDGLGFGTNTKAALLARGLAEMTRLGVKMGANEKTFFGISGLGDLVTTCISSLSRNRFLGEQIGKGKRAKSIIRHMQMIAEGYPTAKSAYELSKKFKVDMPITKEIYSVLYKNKNPLKAVNDLMVRKIKEE
ncbi:MAG: NAD(P)H-dependent glycerol-3-phosphate dehydrogenase [Candidatus Omnitrophota bacterium]|nr:NAD(P)H-dependent glycerol-3-phosphate dehydrogenase [Candidatus Omnitrophota bacterium]